MGRAFTEEENKIIREKLLVEGEMIFSQVGLKKTNVKEITKKVGIGLGTFYRFFDSKEVMFMELLNKIDKESKEYLWVYVKNDLSYEKGWAYSLLKYFFQLTDKRPMLIKLFSSMEDFAHFIADTPKNLIDEHLEEDDNFFKEFLDYFKEKKIIRKELDPNILFGMIKGVIIGLVNREILGEKYIKEIVDTQLKLIGDWMED